MNKAENLMDDYIQMLEDRKNFVKEKYDWDIPEPLWKYFINDVKKNGINPNYAINDIVDNAIVNGDWGNFDEYRDKNIDETDEQFIERVKDTARFIDAEQRLVWMQ